MKKTFLIMAGFVLSVLTTTAIAQEPVQTQQPAQPVQTWDAKKNPTVDSILAKHSANLVPARAALTTNDIFPVLGQYQSTVNADAAAITVSLDAENKGIVWIDGLPQGRVKAYLRKSPAIYKIPAQKTEDGKDIAEGTLIYDKDANTLNIVIGKPYNAEDPALVFTPAEASNDEEVEVKTKTKTAKGKTKTKTVVKPWTYSGNKVIVETAVNTPATTIDQ